MYYFIFFNIFPISRTIIFITDFIQFWVILIPFIVMFFLGYSEIGGMSNLIHQLPKEHLNLFNFGGVAWFLGTIILSGFIFLGTAYHWQRTLSAEISGSRRLLSLNIFGSDIVDFNILLFYNIIDCNLKIDKYSARRSDKLWTWPIKMT